MHQLAIWAPWSPPWGTAIHTDYQPESLTPTSPHLRVVFYFYCCAGQPSPAPPPAMEFQQCPCLHFCSLRSLCHTARESLLSPADLAGSSSRVNIVVAWPGPDHYTCSLMLPHPHPPYSLGVPQSIFRNIPHLHLWVFCGNYPSLRSSLPPLRPNIELMLPPTPRPA